MDRSKGGRPSPRTGRSLRRRLRLPRTRRSTTTPTQQQRRRRRQRRRAKTSMLTISFLAVQCVGRFSIHSRSADTKEHFYSAQRAREASRPRAAKASKTSRKGEPIAFLAPRRTGKMKDKAHTKNYACRGRSLVRDRCCSSSSRAFSSRSCCRSPGFFLTS